MSACWSRACQQRKQEGCEWTILGNRGEGRGEREGKRGKGREGRGEREGREEREGRRQR